MRYNMSVKMNIKDINSICKSKGFKQSVVLKQLFEDKELVKDICDNIFSDANKYLKTINYFNSHKLTSYRTILIDLDEGKNTLDNTLKSSNVSLGVFLSYIIANGVLSEFCSELPDELKMKKCQ